MPQLEKTLQLDLKDLEKKIHMGLVSICALTYKRGRWETTVDGVKCVMLVYEQHAQMVYRGPDPDEYHTWFDPEDEPYYEAQPHYSISITMLDNGKEIKLCAITSGSGREHYFNPDSGAEYGLFEALDITLNNLDSIYV